MINLFKVVTIGFIIIFNSCNVSKNIEHYTMSKWEVCRDTNVVAYVTSTEYEISPKGKIVMEISLTVTDYSAVEDAEDILRFMHTQFPKAKIEINTDNLKRHE